jgi:hypothetical protein
MLTAHILLMLRHRAVRIQGLTILDEYGCERRKVLHCLAKCVRLVRPELWGKQNAGETREREALFVIPVSK